MIKTITLGAGCFWGTQAFFDRKEGVVKTTVGYANGNTTITNYEIVCSGVDNFVEVCQIDFDDKVISLVDILNKYFKIIDPTLLNQQGNDKGVQYRTGIYYNKKDETEFRPIISEVVNLIAKKYQKPIMTEVLPLQNFISAEEYHQKYLEKNPLGYCHINLNID